MNGTLKLQRAIGTYVGVLSQLGAPFNIAPQLPQAPFYLCTYWCSTCSSTTSVPALIIYMFYLMTKWLTTQLVRERAKQYQVGWIDIW